jgi:hypothetical protein
MNHFYVRLTQFLRRMTRYRNLRTSRSSGERRDSITMRAAGIVVAAPTSASVRPALRRVRLSSPLLASRATPAPRMARVLTMKNRFGRVSDRRFMVVFSRRFVCNSHDESLRAEHGIVEPAVALAANGMKVITRPRFLLAALCLVWIAPQFLDGAQGIEQIGNRRFSTRLPTPTPRLPRSSKYPRSKFAWLEI